MSATTIELMRRRNRGLILEAIRAGGADGMTLVDLESRLADELPESLIRGHLTGMGDDGIVWWDQRSPRRVHVDG